jgi:pimeloyl-ACP methyl ester carboxylesterase
MRFRILAASFGVAALALSAATLWRLSAREAAAMAAHPPTGQFVTVEGGAKVHVQVMGEGPDLVLIHGASGNLRDFTHHLAGELATRYRVIALDRPGMGHSDPLPPGDHSLDSQARRLRAAVAELGVTRPIVLGQSYGGAVALAWALQERPAALVLVAGVSMPWPGRLDPWYRATASIPGRAVLVPLVSAFVPDSVVRRAVEGVFAPQAAPAGYADHLGTDLTLRRGTLATNAAQINGLRPQVVAMEPRYPELALPVELIHGDADRLVPLSVHSAPLAERLPQARLTVLPGAGHMPHHTHRAEVIAAIDRAATRAGLR